MPARPDGKRSRDQMVIWPLSSWSPGRPIRGAVSGSGCELGDFTSSGVGDSHGCDRGGDGLVVVQELDRRGTTGAVQALSEGAVRHPVAGEVVRPVLDRLVGKRCVNLGVEGQQVRRHSRCEKEHPFVPGERSQCRAGCRLVSTDLNSVRSASSMDSAMVNDTCGRWRRCVLVARLGSPLAARISQIFRTAASALSSKNISIA